VARSYTTRAFVDGKGLPLINAWCRAFNASTGALVETQYTGSSGTAAFTTLPEDVNVNICCIWGTNVVWLYNIFSATQDLLYLSVTEAVIGSLAVTDAKINDCSIGKLTAGNLTVTGTITTGKFVTGAAGTNRIEIDANYVAGYNSSNALQFYLQASDGKAYAGGGSVILDSVGAHIYGNAALVVRDTIVGGGAIGGYIGGGGGCGINITTTNSTKGVFISALGQYAYTSIAGLVVISANALKLPIKGANPSSPAECWCYYNSVFHRLFIHNGTDFQAVAWMSDL